mgnify:CR=1 FL=1
MKKIFILLFATVFITACATTQQYYVKSNLNKVSIGQSKYQLLSMFPGQPQRGGAPPMQIRAAQKTGDTLVEVGEVLMTDGVSVAVAYWFLFEDGSLVQWGQPADWKEVKARYEISYNPSSGVSY